MSAPSFSSFQPSFTSFPELDQDSLSKSRLASLLKHSKDKDKARRDHRSGRYDEQKLSRHNSDKHDGKSGKKSRRKGRHSRSGSNDGTKPNHAEKRGGDSRNFESESSQPNNSSSSSDSRLFFYDRVGDFLNVRYGGMHVGDISSYRSVAGGKKVLGLDKRLSVLKDEGKTAVIGLPEWKSKTPELTDRRARALLLEKPYPIKPLDKNSTRYEEADGLIRLPSRKGKEMDQSYRSITRDDDHDSDSESSSSFGSQSSGDELDLLPMTAREEGIRNVERKLAENPESVSDWLRLLDISVHGMQEDVKSMSKARAEIAISVLSRAFDAHLENRRSPVLWWKILKAGEDVWDKSRLRSEWERSLVATASADLWVEWLDWRIRASSRFREVLSDATRALDVAGKICSGEAADMARLRVFWRTTIFIRQAGYTERAFAAIQAQSELSFNMPDGCKSRDFKGQLDCLEEFWDSEAPRIGEQNAKGWHASKPTSSMRQDEEDDGERDYDLYRINEFDGANAFDTWHFIESRSDSKLIYPTRTSDTESEDPYATVLFPDIRPFLFPLLSDRGREVLRMIFVSFLGVHVPGLSASLSGFPLNSDDRWADTALMRDAFVEDLFPRKSSQKMLIADSVNGVAIGREKSYGSGFDLVQSWSHRVIDFLEVFTLRSLREKGIRSSVNCNTRLKEATEHHAIESFFEQSITRANMDWKLMSLAFWGVNGTRNEWLEYSRKLLEKDSTSPELLAAHAYIERSAKRYDKAQKVYNIALSSLGQSGSPNLVHLWWGAAELNWLLSNSAQALKLILKAADQPNESSNVTTLRAKNKLEERIQTSASDWNICIKWIKLRVLLELLTGSLDAAIGIGARYMAAHVEGQLQHESLTMAILLLIYDHTVTLRNHAPPSALQELVHRALDIYPANSLVLGLFLECEKGQGVWGRVRELLVATSQESLAEKSVSRRIMDVWIANWEEGRWLGELERARAGLEAAVTCDRTKGSAILWKVFVKLELAAGDLKRAKSILYRALGACPLVKELYLLAFEDLRKVFTNRELVSLEETMAERGLRLRGSLGELIDSYGELIYDDDEQSEDNNSEE